MDILLLILKEELARQEVEQPLLGGQRRQALRPFDQQDAFRPAFVEAELVHHGGQADEDVRAAAEVEAVAGDDLLRRHRPTHDRPALEDADAMPRLGEVSGRDEGVVPRPHHDHVVVARRRVLHGNVAPPGDASVCEDPAPRPGGYRKSSSP